MKFICVLKGTEPKEKKTFNQVFKKTPVLSGKDYNELIVKK